MTIAEWIIMVILAVTLFIFLILGSILIIKLIGITKEAKKILATGQQIADKTDDIVENVKDMTSIGGVVKTFADKYTNSKSKK